MKRLWIPCICLALLFTLASCGQPAWPAASNQASPQQTTAPPATTVTSVTPGTSAPTVAPTAAGYTIKTEDYNFSDARSDMQATYPQLVGAGYEGVNELIRMTALESINGWLGSEDDGSKSTIELTASVTYGDPDFLSITMEEYYNNTMAAHPSSAFRTLNIDLKTGKALSGEDLFEKSSGLSKAIYDAAGKQLSADFMDQITPDDFDLGYDPNGIYFTPDRVGFSIGIFHYLGDHAEITLPYADAKPFMTANPILDRFK